MTLGLNSPQDGAAPEYRYTAELAQEIELNWQERWLATGAFDVPNPAGTLGHGFESVAGKPKLYLLDMFPYPSGAGLHVGHPLGFIASDVVARYYRMRGHVVLHPFGYDAFGLPAEQYAVETGQHPAVTTRNNVDNMRRQLRRLGLAHDPRREISTADPSFYRWTQWIFLKLYNAWFDESQQRARPIDELVAEFESGTTATTSGQLWAELSPREQRREVDRHRLVYQTEAPVNWCPGLGTVLANEEITNDGRSEVGNFPVYRRNMRQWMMRITAYADRLLTDLDLLDWSESLKTMQRNWIGRSAGAEIAFRIAQDAATDALEPLTVFTTRPDTVFGAAFLVLAPEHPLASQLVADAWPAGTPALWQTDGRGATYPAPNDAFGAYVARTANASDRDRLTAGPESGVYLGVTAIHPVTGESLPIFVADYVVSSYGTGAIMAVPAHDQRDFQFAKRFELPIRPVVQPPAEWLSARGGDGENASSWSEAWEGGGVLVNSSSPALDLNGLTDDEARTRVAEYLSACGVGTPRTRYRLRDWLFSRQRYWGEPFPIVYDEDGEPIALPEEFLPVTLPDMTRFQPQPSDADGDPVPPLGRAAEWRNVTLDLGDGPKTYRRETNTMPQWAGSCWYYLRYLDPLNDQEFVNPQVEKFWMAPPDPTRTGGVDLYIGGVEHAVLHLLYARFWHKALFDLGHVSTPEPFYRLFNQGYILAPAYTDAQGRYVPASEVVQSGDQYLYNGQPVTQHSGKMGKSLKNSVAPDEIYADYGADALRLYEMAMGPLDVNRPWRTDDIVGVSRFLQRLWRNIINEHTGQAEVLDVDLGPEEELTRALHATIRSVHEAYSGLRLNLAVARLIELNNATTAAAAQLGGTPRKVAEALVLMLAPLAPHISAEIWQRLGHADDIADAAFPVADAATEARSVSVGVTVNGRVRGQIELDRDASEETAIDAALAVHSVAEKITRENILKVIYVPGRILNFVTTA